MIYSTIININSPLFCELEEENLKDMSAAARETPKIELKSGSWESAKWIDAKMMI